MRDDTAHQLVEINRKFYEEFGAAFSATRQRMQPGVRRILDCLPDEGAWIDLGCGNGSLARAWKESRRSSAYLGLDFSSELLSKAARELGGPGENELDRIAFRQADFSSGDWAAGLAEQSFRGILAFAVLHHVPSTQIRMRLLRQARDLLAPGGDFYLSVWQFQHSPKLMARRLPWDLTGIDPVDLEDGDTLLDWRYALPGQSQTVGLRYVHLFNREELDTLAAGCGFQVRESFESDGQGGKLSLYQAWKAV